MDEQWTLWNRNQRQRSPGAAVGRQSTNAGLVFCNHVKIRPWVLWVPPIWWGWSPFPGRWAWYHDSLLWMEWGGHKAGGCPRPWGFCWLVVRHHVRNAITLRLPWGETSNWEKLKSPKFSGSTFGVRVNKPWWELRLHSPFDPWPHAKPCQDCLAECRLL